MKWGKPLVLLLDKVELQHVHLNGISVSEDVYCCTRILPRALQEITLQSTQDIDVPIETLCLERKERGNMRGVHSLQFLLIPARVFPLSFRPLVNAALYLLTKKSSYSAHINHAVGKSCHYQCENKSNYRNGHWGEVLMK